MINPVNHARTPEDVQRYKVEPYVVTADIYSVSPHEGRGGWSWYTGSAGWMYRVALESILGLRLDGGDILVLNPCIPADWPRYTLHYRPDEDTHYEIIVENPDGVERGVTSVEIDGQPVPHDEGPARIPLAHDGQKHTVQVMMGRTAFTSSTA
jgi:cyclic beta-1,2-glucan synthetase